MRTDRIEPLLKTWEPAIKAAFIEAVRQIRSRIRVNDLVELLKKGDIEGAIQAVGLDPALWRPLGAAVEATFEAGGIDATLGIRAGVGRLGLRVEPLFDVKGYRAKTWLEDHTVSLIRQINDDTRDVIRQTLAPLSSGLDPMLTGDTPQKLALDLVGRINRATGRREGGYLGLTKEQAQWAMNYERQLRDLNPAALDRKLRVKAFDRTVERAIREGKPLPADKVEKMVSSYKNKALLYRAETIALNEASTSLHASQIEAWDQAIDRGVVAATKVKRFWITAGDDHVRQTHREVPSLNKTGVGLHEGFRTYKGLVMQPGWSFDPGCRCRVRVRVED